PPVRLRLPPTVVVPEPVIVPEAQVSTPEIETFPDPPTVPPLASVTFTNDSGALKFTVPLTDPNELGVNVSATVVVPLLKFTTPVGLNCPEASVCVPPLNVIVPTPVKSAPALYA